MLIDRELEEIRNIAEHDKESAFKLINGLANEYPNEAEVWALMGSLYERIKEYNQALDSIRKAIVLSPEEATFYFHSGRCNLKVGNNFDAVNDFSEALIKYKKEDITYSEAIYFYRAEAFIKLGKKAEALSDLSHIPESYDTWTFKLRSKTDLMEDCSKL